MILNRKKERIVSEIVEKASVLRKRIVFDDKDVKQKGEEKVIDNFESKFVVFKLSCCILRDSNRSNLS